MKRRDILKTVAASGIVGIGAGTAAGRPTANSGAISVEDLSAIHVTRDGDVVATLSNPTDAQVDRLFEALGDDEGLVTPQKCCLYECQSQCAYCDYPPGCTDNCCCGWRDDSC